MDEYVRGGTIYYRVSDKGYDNQNVKDTTLHSKFGDLSDGSNYAISIQSGTDSTIGVLDFQVKPPPYFSPDSVLTGFDFNYVNVKEEEGDYSDGAGAFGRTTPLANCNVYLMKEGNVIENEGDVSIVNKDGRTLDYYLSEQGESLNQGAPFVRDNMAVFIAGQHFNSSSLAYTEMFSQTSDVNINKHTTQGVVSETKTPYITLDVANDKRGILTKGYNKETLKAFYAEVDVDGTSIIKLEPAKADNEFPPEKWKPATMRGTASSGLGPAMNAGILAGTGFGIGANPAGVEVAGVAAKAAMGPTGVASTSLSPIQLPQGVKPPPTTAGTSTAQSWKMTAAARLGNANKASMAAKAAPASKVLGPIAVVIGGVAGFTMGKNRASSIRAAKRSGDFSGISRPMFDPVWKHKKIKDDIQYAVEKEFGTTFQKDENAVTTTSSWWDKVKEVTDFEKVETHLAGFSAAAAEDQSLGGTEDKLAKSSINFVTGKEGNCMHMMCYSDYDTSQNCINQPNLNFAASGRPLQQDIYVSKYNLPRPAQFFQNNAGGARTTAVRIGVSNINDGNSVAGKSPTDAYELSFDMMVGNMPVPYAIGYNSAGTSDTLGTNTQVFRRGIAVTFSQKKPKDNESFYEYIVRHTSGRGDDTYNARLMGWVIEKKLSFTGGQPTFGETQVIPIAERNGAGLTANSVNVYRTSAGNTNSNFLDVVTRYTEGIPIPDSTWLRFKMQTNLHGATGKAGALDGRARAFLTIHDAATDEIIDAQKAGGDNEGPCELLSPYPDCNTDLASPAIEDDQPWNRNGEWLPHFTIWVLNHRYNAGGYMDELGDRSWIAADGNFDSFLHDYWQKALQKGAVGVTALNSQAIYADPYELAKTECWVDNMYIRGAECKLTNMSVNEENPANLPATNILNNDDIFPVQNAPVGGGDPVVTTAPTVIAMGFETTTNIAGGTGSGSKFLLFNDFWSDNDPCMPLINDSQSIQTGDMYKHDLYAGYSKGQEKMGDWIDAYTSRTSTCPGLNEAMTAGESSPTTFDVDSTIDDTLVIGDILKIDSEKMQVTALPSATSVTVNRAMYGTAQAAHTTSDTITVYGRSNFKELIIGNNKHSNYGDQAQPDIKVAYTKSAQEEAYAQETSGKAYVEGFSQKGIVQVQHAMTDWVRRECIYASTRIVGIGNKNENSVANCTSNIANVKVANPSVFNFPKGPDGEKYIVYRYGTTLDYTEASGNAAIVTIDNAGDFITLKRHVGTDLGSGKKGTRLLKLITEANLPELWICPWRYWLCISIDAMDKGLEENPLYGDAPDDDLEREKPGERGYGSICSIKPPVFTDATTSSGYDFGTTFNESRFQPGDYNRRRSFDIGPEAAYETELDFGLGAYDLEQSRGGEVTNFVGGYASNRVDLDAILNGLTPEPGDIIGLCISANSENMQTSELHFWSGDFTENTTNMPRLYSHGFPQLVTKYVATTPAKPGLAVRPNEVNPFFPEFHYATQADNLWYGYIIISETDISNKYHGIRAYAPLNDNCDKPWLGIASKRRGGDTNTLKKLKLYASENAIGHEDVGLSGQGDHQLVYATDNGTYNDDFSGSSIYSRQTIEGVSGRAYDGREGGDLTFPYVGGKSMNLGSGEKLSVVMHIISAIGSGNGTMMEIGTDNCLSIKNVSGKVVVRLYQGGANYIELTSTSSLPKDNETPTCIIFTFDKNLLNANCKLYIDGRLEAQSGALKAAFSTANKEWQYGTGHASGGSKDMVIGNYPAIYEELIIYDKVILPIEFNETSSSVVLERNLEEIINLGNTQYNSGFGLPQTWNARMFIFDYHNIRGNAVSQSAQVSWKKSSFPIDGRDE